MRHLGGYTWEIILNEEVPKTFISMECLHNEKEEEKRAYEKSKRKKR